MDSGLTIGLPSQKPSIPNWGFHYRGKWEEVETVEKMFSKGLHVEQGCRENVSLTFPHTPQNKKDLLKKC